MRETIWFIAAAIFGTWVCASACAIFITISILPTSPAVAHGAIAVGSSGNVAADGIEIGTGYNYSTREGANDRALTECQKSRSKLAALCRIVATFSGECFAVAIDPKAGTPGFGWAIAADKETVEDRAMGNCKATAGTDRQEFCQIDQSNCDRKE